MARHSQGSRPTPVAAPTGSQPPVPTTPPSTPLASIPSVKDQVRQLIQELEAVRGRPAIVYWTTHLAKMSPSSLPPLFDQLERIGHVPSLDLLLHTGGGDTEVPWRMVGLIREFCDTFQVLVPTVAASAGTILALGANDVVMTPLASLGPIDPSRGHPLLPRRQGADEADPVSVQDMIHAMNFIWNTSSEGDERREYSPEALATIFTALFDKIHPLAIGAIQQSYALAKLVATKCLSTHLNPVDDAEKIQHIVDVLCDGLKSHAYQISRREAREIGLNVVDATADEERAMFNIYKLFASRPITPQGSKPFGPGYLGQAEIAWLDSSGLNFRVDTKIKVENDGKPQFMGDRWEPY